jgi:hypothetical protein
LEKWQTVNDWRRKLDVWGGNDVEFRAADILGIDLTVFKHAGAVAERSVLRLLLALLEGQREDLVSALAQNLDTDIVIQNMDIACRYAWKATYVATLGGWRMSDPVVRACVDDPVT